MSRFGIKASGRAFAMVCDQMKSNVIVGDIMNDGGTVNNAALFFIFFQHQRGGENAKSEREREMGSVRPYLSVNPWGEY